MEPTFIRHPCVRLGVLSVLGDLGLVSFGKQHYD